MWRDKQNAAKKAEAQTFGDTEDKYDEILTCDAIAIVSYLSYCDTDNYQMLNRYLRMKVAAAFEEEGLFPLSIVITSKASEEVSNFTMEEIHEELRKVFNASD